MKLQPVKSSNVAAIGYLEDERVLLVRYKDGSLYARLDVSLEAWLEFEGSESKGGWLAFHREYFTMAIARSRCEPVSMEEMRKAAARKPAADSAFGIVR